MFSNTTRCSDPSSMVHFHIYLVKLRLPLIYANVKNDFCFLKQLNVRGLHKSVSNILLMFFTTIWISIRAFFRFNKPISEFQSPCPKSNDGEAIFLVLHDNWPDCNVLLLYSPQTLHSTGKSQYLLLHWMVGQIEKL